MDASLQLAPVEVNYALNRIEVLGPDDDFGWLHPAAPLDFILDDQVWRSAKVADWPWSLRKALQSHQTPQAFYRETTQRALTARFRQRSLLLQRLLALRYPVQVKDVPDDLIEEIAQVFTQRS